MKIHIVKKGDTLNGLANKYKVELDAVIALNPQISDPNQIDVGMKVKIPTHPMPVAPPESDYAHKHIVKQGDSLWKLGKAWDIPLQAMIKANPQLKNPNVLMTGEFVYIPKLESNQGPAAPELQPMTAPMEPLAMTPSMYPAIPQHEVAVSDSGNASVEPAPIPTGDQDVSGGSLNASYSDWIQTAQSTPQAPSESAIEEANWNMPSQVQQETLQESAFSEPPAPDLNMPYQQTGHPFAQVHIEATEVFAYPAQMEVSNEPMYAGNQPYHAYPSSPAYQSQPGYSDGGCGCGGYMSAAVQPWNAYPPYPLMTMPSYPTQHFTGGYLGGQTAVPSYPIGGEFASGLPFGGMVPGMGNPAYPVPYESVGMVPGLGMGNPVYPGQYAPAGTTHGMGNPQYPGSYASTGYPPDAHIHQWPGKEDMDPEMAREAPTVKNGEKTASKSTGSAKKKSAAGNDSLTASLRKLQIREERDEPKPNLPWINV